MIELTQVKSTDKLGQLQGILNTAFTEIAGDQPFVGMVMNPSVNYYSGDTLVGATTASQLTGTLYALCFPESNGVFIAMLWGDIYSNTNATVTREPSRAAIDIPAIKLATRDAVVSTFVSPGHLGLGGPDDTRMYLGNFAPNYTLYTQSSSNNVTTSFIPGLTTRPYLIQTPSHAELSLEKLPG